MSDAALVLIDAQESFRHAPYWDDADLPDFLASTQALIEGARARDIPVAQVFHLSDKPAFTLESGFVKTLEPLAVQPAATFHKRRHSALIGTGLDVWLTERGVRRLIVCGIRTEQCCETTTRHASDRGWSVDFVTEATLTFPMTDAAGRRRAAAEIKSHTEMVLSGRFARIATVRQALAA